MELILKNMNTKDLYQLNLKLNSSFIYGVYGEGMSELFSSLTDLSFEKGIITKDKQRLLKKEYITFMKIVKTLPKPRLSTVEEWICHYIFENNLTLKDKKQKITTVLKLVGLNDQYLTKPISTLSTVEIKLLSLAIVLLDDFELLILDDLFEHLDRKYRQKIYRLLVKIKEKKEAIILLGTKDMDILYQYTDKFILFDHNEIILESDTKDLYKSIEFLLLKKIEIPDILMFTHLAKKKGVKLDYHKDVRDLMKDVYKKL